MIKLKGLIVQWQECRAISNSHKLLVENNYFGKWFGMFLKKLNMYPPYDPAILFLVFTQEKQKHMSIQ